MPTTDDIRLAWAVYHDKRETREERSNTTLWETMRDDAYADFDRWLAEHDREVAVNAWNARGILDQNAVAEWSSDAVRASSAISDVGWRDYESRDELMHYVLSSRGSTRTRPAPAPTTERQP